MAGYHEHNYSGAVRDFRYGEGHFLYDDSYMLDIQTVGFGIGNQWAWDSGFFLNTDWGWVATQGVQLPTKTRLMMTLEATWKGKSLLGLSC